MAICPTAPPTASTLNPSAPVETHLFWGGHESGLAANARGLSLVHDFRLVDPARDAAWDSIAASHPESTVFHSSAWARVLIASYGHKPRYAILSRGGQVAAAIPIMEVASPFTGRRGVSLPFSDSCEPLFFENGDHRPLLKDLCALARERRWKYLELRGGGFSPMAEQTPSFLAHTLDLSHGDEGIFARFQPSVQRAIRKAERSDITVEILQTPVAMSEFYRLHCQTRRRHGAPPQPFSFFRHIQEEIIASGLGFIALARSGADCIAASVFFHRGERALYKFGASEINRQHLRPNHLAMWAGIRHLLQFGCRTLHFGRTAPENLGLRRFKRSWGATESALCYLRFDPVTAICASVPSPSSPGFHEKLFTKLPLALNALAGKLIYPHLD